MKTPTLLCVFILLFSTSTYCQEYQAGIRGGINNYTNGDIFARGYPLGEPHVLYNSNDVKGYHFGVYFNFEFDKLSIRPEINYLSAKSSYSFPGKEANWETSKIELPINIGYTIFKPVTIYAGPMINFNGETMLDGVQATSYSDGGPDLKKTTFSFNIGLLIKSGRFGLDFRYEHSFYETEEELLDIIHSTYDVNLVDYKPYSPHVLSVSLLIDLYRTNPKKENGLLGNLFNKNKKCGCLFN